ncbi:MAG TPA: hypothetical protein VM513_07055 [Kofleriaceae bacterium]|nr:hypothetical protein [Kofleriaceae bacterium]
MRTLGKMIFIGLVATTGCKWTDFDDLEGETWVRSVEKPNDDSSDFGIALARGGGAGKLAVLGSNQPQYFELALDPTRSVDTQDPQLLEPAAPGVVLDQALLISNDSGVGADEVALVTAARDGIYVLQGTGELLPATSPIIGTTGPLSAATFGPTTDAAKRAPIVVAGTEAYFADVGTACDVGPGPVHGIGATSGNQIVVWGGGEVRSYDVAIAGTAVTCTAAGTAATSPYVPTAGSRILMADDTHALLVGHQGVTSTVGYLALCDLTAATCTALPDGALEGLRTATLLTIGTQPYVFLGYPRANPGGSTAGQVEGRKLDVANATSPFGTVEITLHDAQPDDSNQQFGRALATAEVGGIDILAVGADNEVFVYFRTKLYGE